MDLVKPDIGLLFWTLISFSLVLFILGKYAWKPILKAIKAREDTIEQSLEDAYKAKQQIANIKLEHEKMLAEVHREREQMLKETAAVKAKIIADAKIKAQHDADGIIKSAREAIHNEKLAAITDLKNQVASLSIEIAEKLLDNELSSVDNQKKLINSLLEDIHIN